MREGVKIVVAIMVALIFAFAIAFIFSERLRGTNDNILEPAEDDSASSILTSLCKARYGNKTFNVSGSECGKGKTTSSGCGHDALTQSCCKCLD